MKSLSVNIIVLIIGLSTMSFLKAIEACDEGWLPSGKSCFFFSNEKKDFGDAERSCVKRGGHLASCLTPEENDFIRETTTTAKAYWIGAIYQRRDNTTRNLDGTLTSGLSYVPPLFPLVTYRGQCLYYWMGPRAYSCAGSMYYLCKKGETSCGPKSECPSGWFQDIDNCYTIIRNSTTSMNGAAAYCNSKGGQLVQIGSQEEQELLFGTVYWFHLRNYSPGYTYQLGAFDPSKLTLSDEIWCNSTIPSNATNSLLIVHTGRAYFCLKPCDDCESQTGAFVCEKEVTAIQST